ncbi:MAG: metal ABC transporter solute-binding protein, Zn/Mn family [Pleomorphochaeta sp.]
MKKNLLLFLSLLFIYPLFSSGQTEEITKPTIAVSIIPQATFVEKIAKDKVDIVTLIPKGSSPENYEPTPKQRIEFENSDLYFSIGVLSEEFNILPMVNKENTKVIYLANEVEEVYPPIYIGQSRDPHIWLSPKRVLIMVDIIERELSLLDSENENFYKENAAAFKKEINAAIVEIEKSLETSQNKSFLVYHPAFSYFADDFNLNMLSIEEEGKEITPKSLIATINKAKELGITNLYYQAEIASEKSISISKELKGEAILLDPLSPNYVENLIIMANTFKENF